MKGKVQGLIKQITPLNQISESFSERQVILDLPNDNPQYPKELSVQFSNKSLESLVNFAPGMNVEIDCEVLSRSSKDGGRYFTTCRGWRIQSVGATMPQNEPRFASQGLNNAAKQFGLEEVVVDDDTLPF